MATPIGPAGAAVLLVLCLTPGPSAEPSRRPAPAGAVRPAPPSPAAAVSPVGAAPPAVRAFPSAGAASPVSPPASAAGAPGTGPAARFRWPLTGPPRVVRRFDPPPRPWLPGHRGVDLVAAPGAEVRAAGAGTVLFAGVVAGRPVLTVGHGAGLRTTYEPVRSRLAAGTRVDAGTPVGELLAGHPGCAVAACLHWGLRHGDDYLDPLALLGLGRVRLLPLDPTPAMPADPGAQPLASSAGSRTASRSYSSGVL
ncbi:murein hydrolase activator EnvC [Micromonospora sp. RP3T]|uniref:murein hydrolase activator EnvC family protein n=1 Tax=Micromonospora sp. RP3T TaxID=2135446 RepID=UPI000D176B2E|nr:M23 family metallopeptidase [Micromonospora sp. RP3T]PTA46873.1 peptidase M23 [Micromonospora sp. RP3T]